MKNLIICILVISCALTGCGKPTASSSMQSVSNFAPSESSADIPEKSKESEKQAPYWWNAPEKPAPETINDMAYWEDQFWRIYTAYSDEYEWNKTEPGLSGFVGLLHRDGILEQLDEDENGFAILEWNDFQSLTSLYFGPKTVLETTADDLESTNLGAWDGIKFENKQFHIPLTKYHIDPSFNYRYEFVRAIPRDENLSRIELVIDEYDTIWGTDERALSATQHYILRWGGPVGYIAEEAYWEYVPTDRVSISGGNVREIAALWDMEPTGYAHQAYRGQVDELSSYRGYPIHVHGEDVYQFKAEDNRILYDRINLETLEQSVGNTLLTAESHLAHLVWRVGDGVAFFADNTLYQFDGSLRLQRKIAVPESIQMAWDTAINEEFTKAAYFVNNDLYLFDFETGGSRLICNDVHEEKDSELDWLIYGLYAVRFTERGDVFVGVSCWEDRAIKYLLISQDGKKLLEVDAQVSEEHSGGYSFSNSVGAFHNYNYNYMSDGIYYYDDYGRANWRYLDFTAIRLKELNNMPFDFSGGIGMVAIPAPQSRHKWYFSEPRGPYNLPDETAFYLIDFDSETYTELPLLVTGARASLMGVSESGRILFNYAYNGERGFGVYTPDNTTQQQKLN